MSRLWKRLPEWQWEQPTPYFYVVLIAFTTFGVSSVLCLASANLTARFSFGLLATVTVSVVQRLAVLDICSLLESRSRYYAELLVRNVFSDWSVMTTSTIAVLHGKPELAQTVLFGVVAVNLLLVLGIYSSYRQYEQVGSLHLSVSILSFVFIAMPTIASTRLEDVALISHTTAIIAISLFIYYLTIRCWHIDVAREAYGLLKLIEKPRDGVTARAEFSMYSWAPAKDIRGDPTAKIITLVVTCLVGLCASFQLVSSVPPTVPKEWDTSLRVKHLLLPLVTGIAEVAALHLRAKLSDTALELREVRHNALTSNIRFFSLFIPACAFIEWVRGMQPSVMMIGAFRIAIYVVAICLQAICDRWTLFIVSVVLYVLYNTPNWGRVEL